MDIDKMSEMAMGLAMYDTYKSAMEKNRGIASGVEEKNKGRQSGYAYHAIINGQQRGPFSLGEMSAMLSAGKITRDTYVWKQGLPDWIPASSLGELYPSTEAQASTTDKVEENGTEE